MAYTYKLTDRNARVLVRVEIAGGYDGRASADLLDANGEQVMQPIDDEATSAEAPVDTSANCIDHDLFVIGTAFNPPPAPADPPKPLLVVTLWELAGGAKKNEKEMTPKEGERPTNGATSSISMLISFLPPA